MGTPSLVERLIRNLPVRTPLPRPLDGVNTLTVWLRCQVLVHQRAQLPNGRPLNPGDGQGTILLTLFAKLLRYPKRCPTQQATSRCFRDVKLLLKNQTDARAGYDREFLDASHRAPGDTKASILEKRIVKCQHRKAASREINGWDPKNDQVTRRLKPRIGDQSHCSIAGGQSTTSRPAADTKNSTAAKRTSRGAASSVPCKTLVDDRLGLPAP